jgi:hypothetical protein
MARRQVIDLPAWCGAATMALCGMWGPPSFVEKLLSGDGVKVTRDLTRVSVAKPWWQVKKSHERDSMTRKQYF